MINYFTRQACLLLYLLLKPIDIVNYNIHANCIIAGIVCHNYKQNSSNNNTPTCTMFEQ